MAPGSDWVAGPHGWALDFDGTDDRVIIGPDAGIGLGTVNACVIRVRPHVLSTDVYVGHKSSSDGGYFFYQATGSVYYGASGSYASVPHGYAAGQEVWLAVSRVGTEVTFYKDGRLLGTTQTLGANNELRISSIGAYRDGASLYAANMRCDYVYVWSRGLGGEEVGWLWREPWCFLGGGWGLELLSGGPTVRELSGTAGAGSSAGGALEVERACDRPTGKAWAAVTLEGDKPWRREALLGGRTGAAFLLGTALTRGRFWVLRSGASAVYRGEGADVSAAAFGSPVAVTGPDRAQVTLPTYLSHEAGSACCYVVRRFNGCGQQEGTVGASAVVRVGADGELDKAWPNPVVGLKAVRMAGDCVRLAWLYCPVGQEAAPAVFRVYGDAGTGVIDFEHALGEAPYAGRKYYSWQSGSLAAGRHRFAVRAETAGGVQSAEQAAVECDVGTAVPGAPDVVGVEAV